MAHPKAPHPHRPVRFGDAGVVLLSSLAKLVLAVAVLGTAGYDSISMLVTSLQTQDAAQQGAIIVRDALAGRSTQKVAIAKLDKFAEQNGVVVDDVAIARDGTVTVVMSQNARTIAASRIPGLKEHVHIVATASADDLRI